MDEIFSSAHFFLITRQNVLNLHNKTATLRECKP